MERQPVISPEDFYEIQQVIARYSAAMDLRNWNEMDDVFLPDARVTMEGSLSPSRAEAVAAIRGFIEHCSVTHHMNDNIRILSASDDEIRATSCFRAYHRGRGDRANEVLECMGTYTDVFRRTRDGWRIAERDETAPVVIGDIARFFAGASAAAGM